MFAPLDHRRGDDFDNVLFYLKHFGTFRLQALILHNELLFGGLAALPAIYFSNLNWLSRGMRVQDESPLRVRFPRRRDFQFLQQAFDQAERL